MDDKFLEKRLQNLKYSYNEIPTVSNSKEIVNKIKMSEQKFKRKSWTPHLPYVASIIGVLLIGGILAMQLLGQNGSVDKGTPNNASEANEKMAPSQAEIDKKSEELRKYYEDLLVDLKINLKTEDIDQYTFVKDSKYVVDRFGKPSFKVFFSKEDLEDYFQDAKNYIQQKLSTPEQQIAIFSGMDAEITDEQMLDFIIKQDELLKGIYEQKWDQYRSMIGNEIMENGLTALLNNLNHEQRFESEELNAFAKDAVKNGYTFVHAGEGMIELNMDYTRLKQLRVSENISDYFTLIQERVAMDAALIISWDELSDRIVALERFILEYPNFPDNPKLYEIYKRYFAYYMNDLLDNTSIYDRDILVGEVKRSYERFFKKYTGTEAAYVIREFYGMLEENEFKRIENPPAIPKLIVEEIEVFTENIEESIQLTDELMSIYKEYKAKEFDQLIEHLRPFDVMRLYMYASDNGDLETSYALLYKGENSAIPSKDQFINEGKRSNTDYLNVYRDVTQFEQTITGDKEAKIVISISDENIPKDFRLQKEHGVWKVSWMPMQ